MLQIITANLNLSEKLQLDFPPKSCIPILSIKLISQAIKNGHGFLSEKNFLMLSHISHTSDSI